MTRSSDLHQNISDKDKKILLAIMFLPCLLIRRVLDNDIWFLLNSGRYVINNGIPYIEPFTIHKDMTFVMQQWLTDVIFWTTFNRFGEIGLFVIVIICYALVIFLMYKLAVMLSNNFFISFVIAILFSIFIYPFMVTRPIIFTLLIVMIELNLLEFFICKKNNKYLLFLPIISFLQINLQAAMWPILFVLLIPYIMDSFNFKIAFIRGEGYNKKYLPIAILLMLTAGFLNPYGIDSMMYLARSYGYTEISNVVKEMLPPNINSFTGIFIYLYMILVILIYCFHRSGKTKLRYFLLTMGTTYMALSSIRNFSFFVISSIFPLSYYLKDFKLSNKDNLATKKTLLLRKTLILLIVIVMIYAFYIKDTKENTELKYKDLNSTIDYILDNVDTSKIILYTGYNDGGLAQYRGIDTYIDPRAEVFVKKNNKKDDIMKEYVDMTSGNLYYKTVLDKYNFTHLLVAENDILNIYLPNDDDYKLIYSNEAYKLFEKIN